MSEEIDFSEDCFCYGSAEGSISKHYMIGCSHVQSRLQVVKEFEKEQKEQRDEDAGTHSKGTQEQDQGQGKELQDVEQGKKQGQDVEQGMKQGQEQDSNTDVTRNETRKSCSCLKC